MHPHGETVCAPVNNTEHEWHHEGKLHKSDLSPLTEEQLEGVEVEYQHAFMRNHRRHHRRHPNCRRVVILEPANNDSFLIVQNGSLHHEVGNWGSKYGEI